MLSIIAACTSILTNQFCKSTSSKPMQRLLYLSIMVTDFSRSLRNLKTTHATRVRQTLFDHCVERVNVFYVRAYAHLRITYLHWLWVKRGCLLWAFENNRCDFVFFYWSFTGRTLAEHAKLNFNDTHCQKSTSLQVTGRCLLVDHIKKFYDNWIFDNNNWLSRVLWIVSGVGRWFLTPSTIPLSSSFPLFLVTDHRTKHTATILDFSTFLDGQCTIILQF